MAVRNSLSFTDCRKTDKGKLADGPGETGRKREIGR